MVSRLYHLELGCFYWKWRFVLPFNPPVFLLARLAPPLDVPLVVMRLSVACRLDDVLSLSAVVVLPYRW